MPYFKIRLFLKLPFLFAANLAPRKYAYGAALSLGKLDISFGIRSPRQIRAFRQLKAKG